MYNLNGKVALVTGSAGRRGIGRACAVRLAKEGADVVVNGRHLVPQREYDKSAGWQGLNSVVKEIEALGRQALAITADVSSSQEVDEMIERALARFGRIDILVNNAGVSGTRGIPVIELEDEDWSSPLAVMLTVPSVLR